MITEKKFGRTFDGEEVTLYSLKNENGMQADITSYGAILVNLFVPNKAGEIADVVLGFDRVKDYFVNGSYFGATVGPVANRTAKGSFEIDGTVYNLVINDNDNNLHTDANAGFHKVVWNAEKNETDNEVVFSYNAKDGELGFPGNREFKVAYKLTADNALEISYYAATDKKTLVNPTNHSYFNLKGHGCEQTIENEKLWLKASHYTEVRAGAIPTGKIAPVAGTPFDFTELKMISQDINKEDEQLILVDGYDHNFAIDDYEEGKVQKIAEVVDEQAGRTMEVYSDLPGVQFYAGNNIAPDFGKENAFYQKRSGLCLETQFFPNSANQEGFIKPVIGPEKPFTSKTIYKFV